MGPDRHARPSRRDSITSHRSGHTYERRWPDDLTDWRRTGYRPDEGDAQAFVKLRRGLGRYGITLLDVMVFDQEFHWWSLHELTTGSTTWP